MIQAGLLIFSRSLVSCSFSEVTDQRFTPLSLSEETVRVSRAQSRCRITCTSLASGRALIPPRSSSTNHGKQWIINEQAVLTSSCRRKKKLKLRGGEEKRQDIQSWTPAHPSEDTHTHRKYGHACRTVTVGAKVGNNYFSIVQESRC